jgi:hypothetical protein
MDEEVLAAVGQSCDPQALLDTMTERYPMARVIASVQRLLERGKITLDSEGMVVATRHGGE